jgi:Flp pilus assembly protein TadD
MERIGSNARAAGFTLCSAMVAALLAGCAGQPSLAGASAPMTDAPLGEAAADKALAKAEARVARSAGNAAARAELAQLYLAAGRFDSAATTFADAVALGDRSPRTGLSLALAQIGSGRNAQALQVLSRWQGQIPAGDFGLALALAGQPAQAVEVLSAALRGGENNPKLRQNLAYAYALDGRWAEARVIAAQDVPADQLDARLQEWASHARPEQAPMRVAGLLGTPLRADPGQPAALALNGGEPAPRLAVAAVPAPTPAEVPAPAELPAVRTGESFWGANQPEPAAIPAAYEAPAPARALAPAPTPAKRTSIERAFAHGVAPRGGQGGHLVQLGSFATREGAQRAWGIFVKRNPALRDHALRVTEARVNGRTYFRVAAEGFDRGSAQSLCSGVKQGGGACLAYADDRAKPGVAAGPRLARSR